MHLKWYMQNLKEWELYHMERVECEFFKIFLSVIWNILQLICSEVLNIKDYPINIKKYKSKPLEDIYDGNIYIMFID